MVQTPSSNQKSLGLDLSNIKKYITDIRRNISKRYLLIEFNNESLTYGEAQIKHDQIYINKLNSINIGSDAIERGTPVDSDLMASFIKEIIVEENIWAHRVGIVLPPQAAFCKIINLPSHLNSEQAREFVISKKSGFQFPIPLNQSDYDLIPINEFYPVNDVNTQSYFLCSIPRKLIDNIIETLYKADLELSFLDLSFSSLEKLAYASINKLKSNNIILILELCNECTHFYIYNKFGPLQINTLAAIRSFPNPKEEEVNNEISLEQNIINSEDYLPITELDLKILIKEIQSNLSNLLKINPNLVIDEIFLSGINSSHPNIAKIFQEVIGIKTSILRPINNDLVEEMGSLKPLINQSLSRIVGLGLNPLIAEHLIDNKEKKINNRFSGSKIKNDSFSEMEFQTIQPINKILNDDIYKNEVNLDNSNIQKIDNDIQIDLNTTKTPLNRNSLDSSTINNTDLRTNNILEVNELNIRTSDNLNNDIRNIKEKTEDKSKDLNKQETEMIDKESILIEDKEDISDDTSLSQTNEEQFIEKQNIETNLPLTLDDESDVLDFNINEIDENQLIDGKSSVNKNIKNDLDANSEENKKDDDFEMPSF